MASLPLIDMLRVTKLRLTFNLTFNKLHQSQSRWEVRLNHHLTDQGLIFHDMESNQQVFPTFRGWMGILHTVHAALHQRSELLENTEGLTVETNFTPFKMQQNSKKDNGLTHYFYRFCLKAVCDLGPHTRSSSFFTIYLEIMWPF